MIFRLICYAIIKYFILTLCIYWNHILWHYEIYVHRAVLALRRCMFYIQNFCGDTRTRKYATAHTPLPPRGPCSSTCSCTPSYALQCLIYGAVSKSEWARALTVLQMHTASSPQCHTHSSASQHWTNSQTPKLSSSPRSTALHGHQFLIWKCYEDAA